MALAEYSDKYWFPNGALAANVQARVFPKDSNALAPLFTDATGGTPLPNPLSTDGGGVLTFFAEVGEYWVHIDSETFLVNAGESQEEADLTTGIASGGELNLTANPTAIEITALVGYVVDNTDINPVVPTIIKVDEPTQTVSLDAASLLRSVTFWLMDSAGTVVQQATAPTPEQRRTHLALGVSLFDTGLGTLIEVQTLPVILDQVANQLADFMDAVGPLSLSGNLVTPNGVNLSINKAAGSLFSRASNHFASGVLTNNPHISASPAQTPATIRRITRTATVPTPPPVTTLDPTQYDNAGVLTPIGGGTNTSSIQRVWVFATNVSTAQIAVQYGQATYANLSAAVAAIGTETFTPAPVAAIGALVGYVCMIRTATDLSNPTQATFVKAGKFPTP